MVHGRGHAALDVDDLMKGRPVHELHWLQIVGSLLPIIGCARSPLKVK